jgi:hypothetical protein
MAAPKTAHDSHGRRAHRTVSSPAGAADYMRLEPWLVARLNSQRLMSARATSPTT